MSLFGGENTKLVVSITSADQTLYSVCNKDENRYIYIKNVSPLDILLYVRKKRLRGQL